VIEVRADTTLDAEDDDEEEEEKAPIETNFSDDEQLATVTITEDFDFTGGERAYVDSEDEDEAAPKKKPLVPLLPASSRRAEQKAKREKAAAEAKERARKDTRAAEKKSTSMETPAERRRAKELEARKRAKKLEKEKKQAEKYGITLIKGRPGGGKGGKPGKPGKPGKGGKGKPAGKKGGKR
jgi:ribosomal RNA-processing protein 17